MDQLRKMSFAGVVLLSGLFLLGLWVISFGPQKVHPRAAAPLHPVPRAVPVKTAAPLTTPASPVASTKTTPAPAARRVASAKITPAPAARVTKDLPEPSNPHRTDSPPVKVARAASPLVAPVVTPVLTPIVAQVLTPATLQIEVDHKFTQAHLSIWVDENLTYTRELEGTDKKRLGVFHHVQGHELHVMQVSPGKHRLRVRVTSGAEVKAATGAPTAALTGAATGVPTGVPAEVPTYDQSAFVDGEFTSAKESVLSITFNKHGEINLSLQ
jgi:outer membrane biosynthesis protein TonB